jgi:O-antigen ligase
VAATAGLVVAIALLAGGRRWATVAAALVAIALAGLSVIPAFSAPDSLQARGDYWHVAWHVVHAHPLLGTGAGTYDLAWAAYGDLGRWGGALDAHSLYLESLAELGMVGFVLVGALLAPLVSVLRVDRRSTASAAALGGAVTFLVHAGLDWDWEMPAVTVAGLVCLAATVAPRPWHSARFGIATASTEAKGPSSDLRPGEAR